MANHIEGTIPDFHEFLDSKPNWVEVSAKRDAARKAWQDRNSQAHRMVQAAYFTQAAEILEDRTVMHYQGAWMKMKVRPSTSGPEYTQN